MVTLFSQTMPKTLNEQAKRANQNIYQTALIEAADLLSIKLFIQPLYSQPNLGQNTFPNKKIRKFLEGCARIINHIQMSQYVFETKKGYDAVLFTHFLNLPVFLTFLFSGFRSKNIFLLAHYMQQVKNHKLYFWLFRFYIWLGYTFLVFEESKLFNQIGFSKKELDHFIVIPHPVISRPEYKKNTSSAQKWVGLIGEIRTEKNISQTLNLLLSLQVELNFNLILGAPDLSIYAALPKTERVRLINTSSTEDYFKAMASCDVVVLNYNKHNYYLRASGIIADALGTNTYIICPNYPLMQHQVMWPTLVGNSFNSLKELPIVLQQTLNLPDANNNPAFKEHFMKRSAKNIASILHILFETKIKNKENVRKN